MPSYPDKSLEPQSVWGCICGRGIFGRNLYNNEDETQLRFECECGLCSAWENTPAAAAVNWNLLIATLTGPYSMMELYYRRIIRIAKESGKDASTFEKMLQDHVQAYNEAEHK